MGRFLLEFAVPALLMAYLAYWSTKFWFRKVLPSQIKEAQSLTELSDTLDEEISNVKLFKVPQEEPTAETTKWTTLSPEKHIIKE